MERATPPAVIFDEFHKWADIFESDIAEGRVTDRPYMFWEQAQKFAASTERLTGYSALPQVFAKEKSAACQWAAEMSPDTEEKNKWLARRDAWNAVFAAY